MAERLAEPDDAAVDELKRKARRRLVGAIVLALAAAILVPMLLEREPRPLGDEVSVQIPPVDDSKFVNRLSGAKGEQAPKADTKALPSSQSTPARNAAVAPSPAATDNTIAPKSISDVEQRVLAPPAHPPTPPAVPPAEKAGAASDAKPEPVQPAVAAKAAPTKTEPPKPEPVASTAAATSAAPAKGAAASATNEQGFVVQLAAFADDKGANSLVGKLKRAGYPAFTEAVQTSRGTLWRVRVGAYPSRDAAGDARAKLKAEGYSGIVAAAK